MDIAVLPRVIENESIGGHLTEAAAPPPTIPRGKTHKGWIVVLVDVEGNGSTEAANELRQTIVDAYYKDPSGSLTSSLRRLLQEANESVYAENERSIRSDRIYASIGCAVIRGDDIFIALVGQALCFGVSRTGCVRLGRSDWRRDDRAIGRIGQVADVGVDLIHRDAKSLSTLILATPGILDVAASPIEQSLGSSSGDAGLLRRQIGQETSRRRDFRSIAIELGATATTGPTPRNAGFGESGKSLAPGQTGTSVCRSQPPLPDQKSPLHRNGSSSGESTALGRPYPAPPEAPAKRLPPAPLHDAIAEARSVMPGVPRQSGRFLRRLPRPSAVSLRAAALMALIVALFAIGYGGALIAGQVARAGADYADAIARLSQAEQHERDALAAVDPLVRRALLNEANQLAAASLHGQPSSSASAAVTSRIQREIESANGPTHLAAPWRVADLPSVSDRLALAANELTILDRTNSRVYLYLLNADGTAALPSDNPVLVRRGVRVGPATIGEITSMTWLPSSGARSAAWVLLDRSGYLIQYVPTAGLSLLALSSAAPWGEATAIRGSGGNVFVLDAKKGSITWFQPQPTGFDGVPIRYLTPNDGVNLGDAIDMVVQNDVYVLHSSGTIDRFADGKPVALVTLPADLLPTGPAGLAVGVDSLFVGDPNHGRILQLGTNGDFKRSLLADDASQLREMRDLSLSEDGKFLYVLSGSSVLCYLIPTMP